MDKTDELLARLLQSKKYRSICPDTIQRIWAECQQKYKKPKDVDKAVRESLHGISGAFLSHAESVQLCYDAHIWAVDGRTDAQLERMLSRHASTRERLPLADMDALYAHIFAVTGQPEAVLDLACGINPMYLGARGIKATGVDISGEAVADINAFRDNYGIPVRAMCADLLCPGAIPRERFDVALLFKVLPLLERQRSGAAEHVMASVNARWLVVSFPTRTLGGRSVGMAEHYSQWMESHLPTNRLKSACFETANELFYILEETHR